MREKTTEDVVAEEPPPWDDGSIQKEKVAGKNSCARAKRARGGIRCRRQAARGAAWGGAGCACRAAGRCAGRTAPGREREVAIVSLMKAAVL